MTRLVHLRWTFDGQVFLSEDGAQVHENHVPDVDGAVVLLHWEADPLRHDMRAAAEAVERLVDWLLRDRGAVSVDYPSTSTYLDPVVA